MAEFLSQINITDEDWIDSLPNALTELRKGRRDMLERILEAAERLERYSYGEAAPAPLSPALHTSARLGQAVDDFIAEHSRQ